MTSDETGARSELRYVFAFSRHSSLIARRYAPAVPAIAIIELIFLGAVWGASFLFTPIAGPSFGVGALVAVRVIISMLILAPFCASAERRAALRGRWPHVVILGLLNTAIPFMLLAYTSVKIGGGFASILNATATLFAAIIARAWLGERLTPAKLAGLFFGIAGVTLLVWDKVHLKPEAGFWPVITGLLGAACYGFSVNFTNKYLKAIPALTLAGASQIGAGLLMVPIAIAFWPAEMPSMKAWSAAIALGVLCTGIAYVMFFRLMSTIGSGKAITVAFLIPMFGVFWTWLFLNERVTMIMGIGGLLVILGLALTLGFLKWPTKVTTAAEPTA